MKIIIKITKDNSSNKKQTITLTSGSDESRSTLKNQNPEKSNLVMKILEDIKTMKVDSPNKKSSSDESTTTLKNQCSEKSLPQRVDSRNGTETKEPEKKIKKPMERYKKLQCWVIVKRMIEGRDGWALKDSPKIFDDSETNKLKPIGLKDIEAKLKKGLYSEPEEFANDVRFVFSLGLLYPPRNEVHRIALRLSDDFEGKFKSLKKEWALEERKIKNKIRKRKRESRESMKHCPKSDKTGKSDSLMNKILKEQSNMFASIKVGNKKRDERKHH